jgi:hypothetical protein
MVALGSVPNFDFYDLKRYVCVECVWRGGSWITNFRQVAFALVNFTVVNITSLKFVN